MEEVGVVKQFQEDDVYKQFLTDDFDVKAVTSTAVQGVAIAEHLAKLSAGITLLDKELHDQVVNHHEDLLSQATGIETLESVLQMVHSRIQTLLSAIERIRTKIVEPYNKVANQTTMLSRLQVTCDLLRRIIRILHLSRRLENQLQGGVREITKAAQSLDELGYLMEGVDLSGLDVIEKDQKFIQEARHQVENQAQQMLEKGMKNQNHSQVATALQVFHNLQILAPTVQEVVKQTRNQLHTTIKETLDVRLLSQQPSVLGNRGAPGRAVMPSMGSSAVFRANLWTNMENLMDHIYGACNKVQHLEKVLAKKRDPVSHVCFLDELAKVGYENIMQTFWEMATAILAEEFSDAANESIFIKQAFDGEYPKLLCLYNDLWKRLQQVNSSGRPSDTDTALVNENRNECESIFQRKHSNVTFNPEKSLKDTLSPFEAAYLARCLSRLYDSVNVVFAGGSRDAPTKDDVKGIVKTISSELNVANVDAKLSKTVAKNVAETTKLFTNKCEQLVSNDQDATQVIDPPTSAQKLNATVVHLLFVFCEEVSLFLSKTSTLPTETVSIIEKSLKAIRSLMENTIQPVVTAVCTAIQSIILTMHHEDFSIPASDHGGKTPEAPCSLYMKELQSFTARARNDYFSQFPDCDIVQNSLKEMACRTIEYFVQHASLVRPLGDGGKMQLAADFAQMEMAVSPLCQRIGDLGKPYRMLRSFRPLLFQTPSHIAQSPVLGDIIPYSVALLYQFSRAPKELRSPHEVAGWTINEYSQWLDDHPSEEERLMLIKGTLEAYVKTVKQKQDRQFCQVYPVMIEMLQRGMKSGCT